MADAPTFGSIEPVLRDVMGSAGPISDAYMLSAAPVALIRGPGGSGKTVASVKKALFEAIRVRPGPDGVRRYVLGVWRQKYDNLWKTTLPSWFSVLPRDMPGSDFRGSSPRAAEHILTFQDKYGPIVLHAKFLAFGDVADPEDLRGFQFTDVYLNEMDTLPEDLFTYLQDRVGRDPPMAILGRGGRFFGDQNAPDVLNWTYRDFEEYPKDGYTLYRQPGGLEPGAENRRAMPRGYYEQSARNNAHRKWWVRRMVHNLPGFTRDADPVYDAYDDIRHRAEDQIPVLKELPILVGLDNKLSPAAVYAQETASGQLRVLAEVALERGGMAELARAMQALEGRRFPDHGPGDFFTVGDPAMKAGEDTEEKSDRQRLADYLGRPVRLAATNVPSIRHDAVRAKLSLIVAEGAPGFLLDPSCKGLRRGFNQTYHYRKVRGTNDLGSVVKTFDSHVHDGLQYLALECGSGHARLAQNALEKKRAERAEKQRRTGRYNPLRRS